MTLALELNGVRKAFTTKVAVAEATFDVTAGCIHGLLGPNGAGKTTLLRMIACITQPDAGYIRFYGQPLGEEHQARMGYMPEERGLYRKMKVAEQLEYLVQLRGLSAADARQGVQQWLERLDLAQYANFKLEELSKGNQQKVQFISTVVHRPQLVILDEPFSGLDPLSSQLVEDILHELCAEGVTILFSTHRMEQVEMLCNSITLIHQGNIVLHDEVQPLRERYRNHTYELETVEDWLPGELPAHWQLVSQKGKVLRFQSPEGHPPRDLIAWANQQTALARFTEVLPTIREIFIQEVGPVTVA